MTRVEEMKRKTLELLAAKYKDGEPFESSTPEQIESRGFLLKEHAEALAEVCRKHGYSVSFREAGAATLERIRQGNPCKGHTIMDKSVKMAGDGRWTYEADDNTLAACRGLVGFKADDGYSLGGLWVEADNRPERKRLHEVTPGDLAKAYTGDYDMHDLLHFAQGRTVRILAATPDEHSAIDRLNAGMLRAGDAGRRDNVAKTTATGSARLATSEYSLIRHGAQTSFMCYLHGITGSKELKAWLLGQKPKDKIPWQDAVMHISGSICMFDNEGIIYLLDTPQKIYRYYASRGLLDQIPFYYFFKELGGSGFLKEYACEINRYLCDFCGIATE